MRPGAPRAETPGTPSADAARRAPDGFTLVEILVALLVLGLVVTGLGQGIRFGLQAWDRASAIADKGNTLDAVDRTLRQLIAQAHPGTTAKPAPLLPGPGRLAFVTLLPALPERPAQLAEVLLMVDERQRLVLRSRPYLHAQRRTPPPLTEAELLRGVSGMELAFWDAGSGWSSTWEGPNLPALLRIRLRPAEPDGRRWPDIVAAPGLDRP